MKIGTILFLKISNLFTGFLLVIGAYFGTTHAVFCQSNTITVCDSNTKNPIAFATVQIDSKLYMTNVQGHVELPTIARQIFATVEHPLYQQKIINRFNNNSKSIIYLEKKYPFLGEKVTTRETQNLMQKITIYKKRNNLKYKKNYTYDTYNKVTLTPRSDSVNKFDKLYKVLPKRIKRLAQNQHLLVLETTTQRKVINELVQKELITAAKSSNVSVPLIAIESSQLHSVSIYDNWLKIGGREFESPLSEKSNEHYIFNIEDTLTLDADTLYRIKFNPIEKHYFKGLNGFMYISTHHYGVRFFDASPDDAQSKLDIQLCQSFRWIDGNWYPFETHTRIATKHELGKISFVANIFTQINHLDTKPNLSQEDFDETILHYPATADNTTTQDWAQTRPIPLTPADSATYHYYEIADKNKFIQKSLQLGENLYFGFFPLGKINFDMHRFVNFNKIEKIRLGLGLETNPKFSEKHRFGMYAGYGLLDKQWKYGANYSIVLNKNYDTKYESSYTHELQEAGLPNFPFDRYQYSSEILRNFNLQIMDFVSSWQNSVTAHPIDFLDVSAGVSISRHQNNYTYNFKGTPIYKMDFIELLLGARYAFGERNIQYLLHKKYLPSKFPIAYLQLAQGVNAGFGHYAFSKLDFKIEQYIRLFGLGVTKIQLLYTKTSGNAPYSKLFNGKGSQQNGSVIIHNSFETMQYNEFLSDEFVGLFFSHDIGKLHTPYTFSQPSLTLIHNMGAGSLANTANHENLPFRFKTMEKGFVESGGFFSNLLIIRLNGLKIGLGAGLIYRYGPYASLKASQNTIFKFALTFRM